ncbi:alanine racemase [Alicyclobacillus fastidiosus]|uniref:Alanine racemase n=1 Tax=Alicyclobacillus fastidiosus TaxID=392011 RepID=A0ABV5AF22_9BACL|nr:alanine racemase [Alicyclobacillus fastidiosus]WEH09432.1 alanine racemase [Alicyclobacillus fastidiosus]
MYRGTFSIVDLRAFAHNLRVMADRVHPETKLLVTVKANAYGHGVAPILEVLTKSNVVAVGVASLEEALQVRQCGYAKPVLILGSVGAWELPIAAQHQIHVTYTDAWGDIDALPPMGSEPLHIHTAFDTGMNRLGFKSIEHAKVVLHQILNRSDMTWSGVSTHLACSDGPSDQHALEQIRRFSEMIAQLRALGYDVPTVHASNSGGVLRNGQWHFDMVRIGIAAYGYSPDESVLPMPELRPVMHMYSSITRIADVLPGETIGYGATFTATKPMRVATVAAGYADGYPRALSNSGKVLVCGQTAPVVGRICMDQLMIDVSDVPTARVGDFVTLFGNAAPRSWTPEEWNRISPDRRREWLLKSFESDSHGEQNVLSLSDVASRAMTIPYEMVCQINPRVPKLYVNANIS